MKINRWAVGVATVAILALSGAVTAIAAAPPYDPDPDAFGTITFYDAAGAVVTSGSGSTSTDPKYAVASARPTVAVEVQRGALYGYLPVAGVHPGNWSGLQISSSTAYPISSAPASVSSLPFPATQRNGGTFGDASFFALASVYPQVTTGVLANVYQIRLREVESTEYASASVTINQATGAWAQVFPEPAVPPTSAPPTTVAPTTVAPTTVPPTTVPPTTVPPTTVPPTTVPSDGSTTGAVVATSNGTVLLANATLARGDIVTLTAQGFAPGEQVAVALDGQSLGSVTATQAGSISFPFTVPADQAYGAASVTFTGVSATRTFAFTASGIASTTSGSGTTSGTNSSSSGNGGFSNAGSSGNGSVLNAGSSSGNRSTLANTGLESLGLAGSALVLLLLGSAMVMGERRLSAIGGKHRL